jgi:hypothetical protein
LARREQYISPSCLCGTSENSGKKVSQRRLSYCEVLATGKWQQKANDLHFWRVSFNSERWRAQNKPANANWGIRCLTKGKVAGRERVVWLSGTTGSSSSNHVLPVYLYLFFFFKVVLGFELRVSPLLGRVLYHLSLSTSPLFLF